MDGRSASYHHGHLRDAALEAALDLGRQGGPQAIVVREVARRSGVSATAVYRHFVDRDAIVRAIATKAMADLHEAMIRRCAWVRSEVASDRARLRLRAIAEAYVGFAVEEPGLFVVAFNGPTFDGVAAPYQYLTTILDECLDTGYVNAERRRGAELVCWANVHGFAILYGSGPMREATAQRRADDLGRLLDRIEDSIRA